MWVVELIEIEPRLGPNRCSGCCWTSEEITSVEQARRVDRPITRQRWAVGGGVSQGAQDRMPRGVATVRNRCATRTRHGLVCRSWPCSCCECGYLSQHDPKPSAIEGGPCRMGGCVESGPQDQARPVPHHRAVREASGRPGRRTSAANAMVNPLDHPVARPRKAAAHPPRIPRRAKKMWVTSRSDCTGNALNRPCQTWRYSGGLGGSAARGRSSAIASSD